MNAITLQSTVVMYRHNALIQMVVIYVSVIQDTQEMDTVAQVSLIIFGAKGCLTEWQCDSIAVTNSSN